MSPSQRNITNTGKDPTNCSKEEDGKGMRGMEDGLMGGARSIISPPYSQFPGIRGVAVGMGWDV